VLRLVGKLTLGGGNRLRLSTSHGQCQWRYSPCGVESDGNTVTCYVNGVLTLSGADPDNVAGQPGMFAVGAGGIQAVWTTGLEAASIRYSTSDQEEDRAKTLHVPSLTIGPNSPGSHGDIPFGAFYPASVIFGNLGTPDNGAVYYCPDCHDRKSMLGRRNRCNRQEVNGAWCVTNSSPVGAALISQKSPRFASASLFRSVDLLFASAGLPA